MWPFTLYRKIKYLTRINDIQSKSIARYQFRIESVECELNTRGQVIVNLRNKVFSLQNDLLNAADVISAARDVFVEIANHGTQFPNGTVQRMARTANAAIASIDNTVLVKPASSAAEEMVKAA